MKRTQIQLDDDAYELLRRTAFDRGVSVSALVREMVQERLGPRSGRRRVEELSFVGSGRNEQDNLSPVSERHDEALAESFEE